MKWGHKVMSRLVWEHHWEFLSEYTPQTCLVYCASAKKSSQVASRLVKVLRKWGFWCKRKVMQH